MGFGDASSAKASCFSFNWGRKRMYTLKPDTNNDPSDYEKDEDVRPEDQRAPKSPGAVDRVVATTSRNSLPQLVAGYGDLRKINRDDYDAVFNTPPTLNHDLEKNVDADKMLTTEMANFHAVYDCERAPTLDDPLKDLQQTFDILVRSASNMIAKPGKNHSEVGGDPGSMESYWNDVLQLSTSTKPVDDEKISVRAWRKEGEPVPTEEEERSGERKAARERRRSAEEEERSEERRAARERRRSAEEEGRSGERRTSREVPRTSFDPSRSTRKSTRRARKSRHAERELETEEGFGRREKVKIENWLRCGSVTGAQSELSSVTDVRGAGRGSHNTVSFLVVFWSMTQVPALPSFNIKAPGQVCRPSLKPVCHCLSVDLRLQTLDPRP
eukprot:1136795-Rhodomonas_salina.1